MRFETKREKWKNDECRAKMYSDCPFDKPEECPLLKRGRK